jgi:hypothetical protein
VVLGIKFILNAGVTRLNIFKKNKEYKFLKMGKLSSAFYLYYFYLSHSKFCLWIQIFSACPLKSPFFSSPITLSTSGPSPSFQPVGSRDPLLMV